MEVQDSPDCSTVAGGDNLPKTNLETTMTEVLVQLPCPACRAAKLLTLAELRRGNPSITCVSCKAEYEVDTFPARPALAQFADAVAKLPSQTVLKSRPSPPL